MGTSSFADIFTFKFENMEDVDFVSIHMDDFLGIPWTEFQNNTVPPPAWAARIKTIQTDVAATGKTIFLSLGPLADRKTLARGVDPAGSPVNNWAPVDVVDQNHGRVVIIAAVPSLDTPTCDMETRRFNQEAANLGDDIRVYVISTDFPMAQKRWCGNAGVDRVQTVSDVLNAEFGVKYGVLVKERRYLRRAVFVVDRTGKLSYVDYMPKLGDQPDYDAVLNAAKAAL